MNNLKSTKNQSALTIHRLHYNHELLSNDSGFTIVELLVVIVVIGILATITMVSYTGITQKATEALLQSDLSNSRKALQLYQATYGSYPTALDANNCPSAPTPDTNPTFCLKSSASNDFTDYISDGTSFNLELTSANNTVYSITDASAPELVPPTLADTDPANWMTIGTQVWAKYNLNVGTMISGATNQTNNGRTNIIEKYCYGDTEAGCTAVDAKGTPYGALYQWEEAMNYSTAEKAQGLCPDGSHIPSDAEWAVLTGYLGSATAGTQLKPNGASGMNIRLAGYRNTAGFFINQTSGANLWSSSASGASVWIRKLRFGDATVDRYMSDKANGFSVRCLGN